MKRMKCFGTLYLFGRSAKDNITNVVQLCFWMCLAGWTAERVQEYFLWAFEVVNCLKGTNLALEKKLEELFKERGVQLWQEGHNTVENGLFRMQIKCFLFVNIQNKSNFMYITVSFSFLFCL